MLLGESNGGQGHESVIGSGDSSSPALRPCDAFEMLIATVKIGVDGLITGEISFDSGGRNLEKTLCRQRIREIIVGGSYIAGRFNGNPFGTTYVFAGGLLGPDRYEPVMDLITD